MAHTHITSGEGVPSNLPARLRYQAGALLLGCKVEVQAIAARA